MPSTIHPPSAPLQREFDLQLPVGRPLIHLQTVIDMTNGTSDSVLLLIEDGQLEFAWDISSQGCKRREIRVWRDSLLTYLASREKEGKGESEKGRFALSPFHPGSLALFSHARETVKTTELQRIFSASQTHVQDLIREGCLVALTQAKPGPGGFALVTRESVVSFLVRRRIV